MKRPCRIILSGITALSLVLCVATVALWVRSGYVSESFGAVYEPKCLFVAIDTQAYVLSLHVRQRYAVPYSGHPKVEWSHIKASGTTFEPPGVTRWFGIRFLWLNKGQPPSSNQYKLDCAEVKAIDDQLAALPRKTPADETKMMRLLIRSFQLEDTGHGEWIRRIGVPFWLVFTLTAVLPALRARQWYTKRNSRRIGLCPVCSYDLRATPTRCPECGTLHSQPTPAPKIS